MPARRMLCDACWEPVDHRFKRCPHCRHDPRAGLRLLLQGGKLALWGAAALLSVNLLDIPTPQLATPDETPSSPTQPHLERFVSAPQLNVRAGPDPGARILTRLSRGDAVRIYQRKKSWVRISPYATVGGAEGGEERVAEWVPVDALSRSRPLP